MPTKTIQLLNIKDALQAAGIEEADRPHRLIGQIVHARFEWQELKHGEGQPQLREIYHPIAGIVLSQGFFCLELGEQEWGDFGDIFFDFEKERWYVLRHAQDEKPFRIYAHDFELFPNPIIA